MSSQLSCYIQNAPKSRYTYMYITVDAQMHDVCKDMSICIAENSKCNFLTMHVLVTHLYLLLHTHTRTHACTIPSHAQQMAFTDTF